MGMLNQSFNTFNKHNTMRAYFSFKRNSFKFEETAESSHYIKSRMTASSKIFFVIFKFFPHERKNQFSNLKKNLLGLQYDFK